MSVFEQGRVLEDAPPCATGRACRCTQSCYEFAFFFFGNLTVAYNKLSTIVPVRALKHTLCRFVAQCGFFSISQVLLRASWLTFRLSYGDERSVRTPAPQKETLANLGMQLQYLGAAFWKAWGRLVEMSFPGCFLPLVKQDNFFFLSESWELEACLCATFLVLSEGGKWSIFEKLYYTVAGILSGICPWYLWIAVSWCVFLDLESKLKSTRHRVCYHIWAAPCSIQLCSWPVSIWEFSFHCCKVWCLFLFYFIFMCPM